MTVFRRSSFALQVLLLFVAGLHHWTPEKLPQVGADDSQEWGGQSVHLCWGKKNKTRKNKKKVHASRLDKMIQMVRCKKAPSIVRPPLIIL